MHIVHINKSDTSGGAAVAAMRLVRALNQSNINASMLVAEKKTNLPWVETIANTKFEKAKLIYHFAKEVASFIPHEKEKKSRFAWSAGKSGFDISNHPLVQNADIIHLHWINQGFISIKGLRKLFNLGKPVVWTLHDMWSFTGGCHYAGDCHNFEQHCGFCPFLCDPSLNDISHQQHNKKTSLYKNANLHVVTCSNWLARMAEKASLYSEKKIISIPNSIETDLYHPKSQVEARRELNLPQDKKIILFGAANVTDPRKGMTHLVYALNHLAKKISRDKIELVVFGKAPASLTESFPYPVRLLNYIEKQDTLINLYNAADVFVLPSLEDNLPNTVMEAMASGLPVAAFRIGGVPEMVTHGVSGYLSAPGDGIGLAEGIEQLIFNKKSAEFRFNARKKVEKNYDPTLIAHRYLDLYKSILEK